MVKFLKPASNNNYFKILIRQVADEKDLIIFVEKLSCSKPFFYECRCAHKINIYNVDPSNQLIDNGSKKSSSTRILVIFKQMVFVLKYFPKKIVKDTL